VPAPTSLRRLPHIGIIPAAAKRRPSGPAPEAKFFSPAGATWYPTILRPAHPGGGWRNVALNRQRAYRAGPWLLNLQRHYILPPNYRFGHGRKVNMNSRPINDTSPGISKRPPRARSVFTIERRQMGVLFPASKDVTPVLSPRSCYMGQDKPEVDKQRRPQVIGSWRRSGRQTRAGRTTSRKTRVFAPNIPFSPDHRFQRVEAPLTAMLFPARGVGKTRRSARREQNFRPCATSLLQPG